MRTLIIAEAGVNHNGSLETAKKLALTAKKCGADIVKFQTAKLNSMVSKHAYMADYQKKNIGVEMSQRDMLKKLLLTYNEFIELAVYCKQINVCFWKNLAVVCGKFRPVRLQIIRIWLKLRGRGKTLFCQQA